MGAILAFLSADHDRLDGLLDRAGGDPSAYAEFRKGLLKHVGMEELILMPAALKLDARLRALAAKIRLDHAALTSLLIPKPTANILAALRAILVTHNALEERDEGLYIACEAALGEEAHAAVLRALKDAVDIPPAAHADNERVYASIRAALDAAGYGELPVP